jgi:glyoxylase-like metal-dependent hydrolase (beta-lactamase superfamily II)
MEVAGGVHRHGAGIANWYIIEEGGRLTLVDAGVPGDWNAFVAAVGSLGKTLEDV